MNIYLLAAIGIIGLLILLQQMALRSYTALQKSVSSKIVDFLRQNRLKQLLEMLTLASALTCLVGIHYNEWISVAGVILGLFCLWALSGIYWSESNPFHLLLGYEEKAGNAVAELDAAEVCTWIDGVHEIAYKSLENNSTPLTNAALNSELQIGRVFLSEAHTMDLQKIGYVMFFLFERLESLFNRALERKLELICSQINTTYGKVALHALTTHPSFAGYSVTFAGKLAVKAVKDGLRDVGIKTGLMLIELSKSITNEISLDEYDLREPLLGVVKNLEEISKEIYRQEKSIPLEIIREPLLQLKTVLVASKSSEHPTVVLVIADTDRVLAEFQALEVILNTIPPIPELPKTPRKGKGGEKIVET